MQSRFIFSLFYIFIFIGLAASSFASAASGVCPTDNGAGVVCSGGTPYYCLSACRAQTQCPSWTGTVCATGITCPANCSTADSCGYCNACSSGYTLCGSYPSQTCTANTTPPANCTSYNQCTATCSACALGYTLSGNTCVGATLKLGTDSVGGSNYIFQSTNPYLYILSSGYVGIGAAAPNDIFSIGNGGLAAPAGSANTGHNYTSTYLDSDNYALVNYGLLKGYLPLLGGSMSGDISFSSGTYKITGLDELIVRKITADTIDPLYTINNINYSTFAPSIAGGVKEEYIGKADIKRFNAKLNEYEYIINFTLEDEGNDLWVWRKVVDYSDDNVQVFITPSGKFAQVYYVIDNNKLIFRSDKPVKVSYRLIGKRFDWLDWPTKAFDQTRKGIIIK